MIYMVELDWHFDDPVRERSWEAWYEEHLARLLSVPGFTSAQRFHSITLSASPYLAVYGIESLDVFESEPYRAMAGPNSSREFHSGLRNWFRNSYEGLDRAPAVGADQCLATIDEDILPSNPEMGSEINWMTAVGHDRKPRRRGLAVIGRQETAAFAQRGARVLKPLTGYLTPHRGCSA